MRMHAGYYSVTHAYHAVLLYACFIFLRVACCAVKVSMVDLSCARCSGGCCFTTCMHGWQLPAGRKHGRMRIKEDALQTMLNLCSESCFVGA
jgi:hypothetical protein